MWLDQVRRHWCWTVCGSYTFTSLSSFVSPPCDSCHWGTRGGAEHRLILIALHQVDREAAFLPGFSSIYSDACCGGYCRCAHSHPAATRLQPLAGGCLSHVLPVQHVHGHCCLARETPPVGGDVIDLSSPSTWNQARYERSSGSPDATAAAAWTRSYPPASLSHLRPPGSASCVPGPSRFSRSSSQTRRHPGSA